MQPSLLLRQAIRPALALLPPAMTSREAEALLVAIAWQESECRHRRQVPVPYARSYWQFERGGGVAGVLRHRATGHHARQVCAALDIDADTGPVYEAMEYQDVLAAAFARLLLWTLPGPLPTRGQRDTGWAQYLAAWRPGKPHEHTWSQSWLVGWTALAEVEQADA